ncbi:MAG: AGE family epimerase/isomerase [Acidobacteriales bacterium]|nr:AGE family epimerase/isomerase [Terriglobales bacterium]
MLTRRRFLGSSAAVSVSLARESGTPPVCLAVADPDQSGDMPEVFKELGLDVQVVPQASLTPSAIGNCELLWIVAPSYPEPAELSRPALDAVAAVIERGGGVFAEYVTNFPEAPAGDRIVKTGIARLMLKSRLDVECALEEGTLFDEHDSYSLPFVSGKAWREVLSFGRVAGVERVLASPRPQDTWPGLVMGSRGTGRFAVAGTSLSEFRRRQYAPVAHWSRLLRELVLALLPPARRANVLAAYIPLDCWTEPRRWVMPGEKFSVVAKTRPGASVQVGRTAAREVAPGEFRAELAPLSFGDARIAVTATGQAPARLKELEVHVASRHDAYLAALTRNIRWFEKSGVLLAPDGSAGVAEWISGPDFEGRRIAFGAEQMFSPERADCVFESGLAFWLYGQLTKSFAHRVVGQKMLERIMDFQRLERGDPGYGLWNTRGRAGSAFPDDTSWGTICALAAHRYTRNRMFLRRGVISAEAQLAAFGADVSRHAPHVAKFNSKTPLTRMDEHPHSGGCVIAAWLYAYGVTGEQRYLREALPMLDAMIAGFPKIRRYIISRTCESSRFLLPLALAWYYTREARYKQALEEQAAYLRERMAPCGAIREDGSNTGSDVEGGDLGLSYTGRETVSDQLYTTSFAAMNFWIAYKATGDRVYLEDFHRVADYLVRIQIESADPVIDGGWMRGFDYSLWEYYGSNADQWWNAYVMETGWQNAIIDIALALYMTDDPFFVPRSN